MYVMVLSNVDLRLKGIQSQPKDSQLGANPLSTFDQVQVPKPIAMYVDTYV